MRYVYVKNTPGINVSHLQILQTVYRFRFPIKILSSLLILNGLSLIMLAILPIFFSRFFVDNSFASYTISPLPNDLTDDFSTNRTYSQNDYSQASNWFPSAPKQKPIIVRSKSFTLKIPKAKINQEALAITSAEDLFQSLIHWGGTAFPGEFGNSVIFGHSTNPLLFKEDDYKSVFSYLWKLKKGDEILINYDLLTYRYEVIETKIIDPARIDEVFRQDKSDIFLTLVTCDPPGTYWQRLIVKAKLAKI